MNRKGFGKPTKEPDFGVVHRQQAALLGQLRAEEERRIAREAIASASHLRDEALLDELVGLGINADTLTALSLVPLVEIAWVDGTMDDSERRTILAVARRVGLTERSTGYRLIEGCLSDKPPSHLRSLWVHYVESLCSTLSDAERETFRLELLQRALRVAEAAGAFTTPGSNVSSEEQALLGEIARVFDDRPTKVAFAGDVAPVPGGGAQDLAHQSATPRKKFLPSV